VTLFAVEPYEPVIRSVAVAYRAVWRGMKGELPQPPGEWIADAACKGQRMYYSCISAHANPIGPKDRIMESHALATCASCPVLEDCQTWALSSPDPAYDHVAGGMTPRQRWTWRKRYNR
jgi:hypothetical protein